MCGRTFDGRTCRKRGSHLCVPRADHAQAFAEEICVHTKDRWARRPFILAEWQREEIVRPLFGEVRWDDEAAHYVRRYRIAWIEIARKNGKSELLAFVALYLLVGDGVEGAEIYGAAKDRAQAAKVFDVEARMVALSPVLSKRLVVKDHVKRIVDEKTSSFYEVIAADATGNLGHNPSGVIFDEVLTQPDGRLWDALRTGMGTRAEPLMVAATTAGDTGSAFAKAEHDECLKIQADPARAPHRFVYIRALSRDADPFDESLWHLANPALGDFLSVQSLRDEALEARNDPSKENSWRQFRCNQWVGQSHRWMPMHLYALCVGTATDSARWLREQHARKPAWGGLDLASKMDLTAWCVAVPDGIDGHPSLLWRFWLPEGALAFLDERNEGKFSRWVEQGWLRVTDGDVIDYESIYDDLAEDGALLRIADISYDEWSGEPARERIQKRTGAPMYPVQQTYRGMTPGMTEIMARTKARTWSHHGNPIASWCFDNVEVLHPPGDPDLLRPSKPERGKVGLRIDAVPAASMALAGLALRGTKAKKPNRMMVLG
ncbi:terminase large subunit [Actinosynnema mirum]|uniref:Terminase n=1 Tax=Actinosynnema mirum (strain ATCC 29888 / DSM 43827 / JCM 3225 / NBRC 14064 / NCIMB 13271 / NRRL B-12336 / IMRU 3971 / 101) TaxID=446462 RepID=C6W8S2_ACTMD|nr:terminase TerL endonuclease subunit [Actinosynnema mirum]ACU37171.1 Terminase [Actinosynnema mirum DSM 43827]